MKFLPRGLIQVKYKILWLYSKFFFFFLDEHNKNGSFQWILAEKWPWSFRG